MELDAYAGVKVTTGKIAWDLGIIYYAYPNQASGIDPSSTSSSSRPELSTEVWKGGTLGGTVFYSPDYTRETGNVWTLEGSFSQALPDDLRPASRRPSAHSIGYQKGERQRGLQAAHRQ